MPVSVTMPRLGESVTEGTVTRWLKQEGDRVEVDEPLLEVSTDKVDTEIPSPAAGILSRIVVAEDETVEVGSELAVIAGDGEDAGTAQAPPSESEVEGAAESPRPEAESQAVPAAKAAEPEPAAPAPQPAAEKAPAPPAPAKAAAPAEAPAAQEAADTSDATAVKMPALGESVTEGTVTRWLKQVGDSIEADEPLLEVSTDKVDTEIPSPVSGVVVEIKVAEDEVVPVGTELALIGSAAAKPAAKAEPAKAEPAKAEPAKAPAPAAQAQAPAPQAPAPQAPAPQAPAPQAQPARPAQAAAKPAPKAPAEAEAPAKPEAPAQAAANGGTATDAESYVTPLVRKLATEHGVNLSTLTGTGVGGRIRKQDVLDAAERAKQAATAARTPAEAPTAAASAPKGEPSPLRGRTEKMSRLRALIARRMVESLQVSAQLTTVVEVDVTRIAKLRQQAKAAFEARHGVKLSFLPFFVLATIEALRVHPTVNASIDQDAGTITYHDAEHVGIAVDTERGLVVPVIRDAGDLNLGGLAKRIADLAARTRSGKISPDELSGGTFTVTNTGSRGALFDTPIINQPQVGILGTGTVVKRPVVVDDPDLGEIIATRSMIYLALSYDHRLVDGAEAARFLNTIKERLEAGSFQADLGV